MGGVAFFLIATGTESEKYLNVLELVMNVGISLLLRVRIRAHKHMRQLVCELNFMRLDEGELILSK
jgi:hypothetical protein